MRRRYDVSCQVRWFLSLLFVLKRTLSLQNFKLFVYSFVSFVQKLFGMYSDNEGRLRIPSSEQLQLLAHSQIPISKSLNQ